MGRRSVAEALHATAAQKGPSLPCGLGTSLMGKDKRNDSLENKRQKGLIPGDAGLFQLQQRPQCEEDCSDSNRPRDYLGFRLAR